MTCLLSSGWRDVHKTQQSPGLSRLACWFLRSVRRRLAPPAVVLCLRHLDGIEALAAASIDWPEARIDVDLAAISDELGLDARGSDVASCPCDNSSSHPPAIRRMLLAVALRFPLMAASIWSFVYFMLWSPVLGGCRAPLSTLPN